MKKFLKILLIIIGILVMLLITLVLFFMWSAKQPAVKPDYYKNTTVGGPLEQKYTDKGTYDVSYAEYSTENVKTGKYEIWYPSEMETSSDIYPLVIMANGTGVKASRYEAIFDHLASWGFIVIGNEDENSWDGVSSSESLDFMLNINKDQTSIFFHKIDLENIGAAGHSQGGIGAVNAVSAQENSCYYKTIYTASTTSSFWCQPDQLGWTYDVSQISIPYFMTAGTKIWDSGETEDKEANEGQGITPLWSLKENYDATDDAVFKVMARRTNADHSDMLACGDGYMTAWFMYHLKEDAEAGKIFIGNDAEISANVNWQDIKKNR